MNSGETNREDNPDVLWRMIDKRDIEIIELKRQLKVVRDMADLLAYLRGES